MTLAARHFPDPAPATAEDRRAAARRPVEAVSTARIDDAPPADVIVHDLSADGFAIHGVAPLAVGTSFSIGLPGVGRFPAQVVRNDGDRHGCRFDAPLPAETLAMAFAADPVVALGAAPSPLAPPYPEPHVDKWHPAMRIALLLGLTTCLWTSIIKLI